MNEIELKINVEEANVILEALGQLPFAKVYNLVGKIQDQAAKQLNNNEPAAAEITQLDTKNAAEG